MKLGFLTKPYNEQSRLERVKHAIIILLLGSLLFTLLSIWEFGREREYWGKSDQTIFLEADPMSDPQLLGLTIVTHSQTKTSVFKSKRSKPFVRNTFKGKLDANLFMEFNNKATSNGWKYDIKVSDRSKAIFRKEIPECKSLRLTLAESIDSITVELRFEEKPIVSFLNHSNCA